MLRTISIPFVRKVPRFWAFALCFLLVAFAVAQDVRFNRSAMEGRFTGSPSTVAIRVGSRRVARSRAVHRKRLIARSTVKQRTLTRVKARLASLKGRNYTRKTYIAQRPGNGTATRPGNGGRTNPPTRPNGVAQVVLEIPRQNLTFKLLDPRGQPVRGVQMVAYLQTPTDSKPAPKRFTSNAAGVCQLKDLPVPASLDFDIVRSDGSLPPRNTEDDENSDWRFAHPETALLLLEKPEGAGRFARTETQNACFPTGTGLCISSAVTKTKIYQTSKPPIVLERNVFDLQIAAPANARVSSPLLGDETKTVPSDGVLSVRLKRAQMEAGAVPIRVERALPGGDSEAVIASYPTDPYATNRIQTPPLQLVSLSNLDPNLHMGVFDSRDDAVRAVGDLTGKANRKNDLGAIRPSDDGAQWWISPTKGIGLKMRPVPGSKPKDKTPDLVCERIRVFNVAGGSFGGVGAGTSWADARAALGEPQLDNAPHLTSDSLSAAGQIASYLDGGLRVCHNDDKVLWLEVARPDAFLQGGTTAFVPRTQAKLYIAAFSGNSKTNLRTRADLENYLRQIGSVQLVSSRDEADLVLDASVVDFKDDRDNFLGLIPIRYNCTLRLQYSLYDTHANRYIAQRKEVEGHAGANFTKEAALIGIGAGLLYKKTKGIGTALIAGFGIAELNHAVRKAANRAPAVAAKTAFSQMVDDINNASDFSVQVTSIDYASNCLNINAGTNDGVRVGDAAHPFDFQLQIAGGQLPLEDEPKSAEYYAARVVQAGPTSSVCELRHVQRSFSKAKEKVQDEPAPEVLRQIPDPATGLVGGRAGVRFPDIEVVTEAQVEAATRQAESGQQNAPDNNDQGMPPRKKKNLGNILGGILGR